MRRAQASLAEDAGSSRSSANGSNGSSSSSYDQLSTAQLSRR
jgi:hypothetical protein